MALVTRVFDYNPASSAIKPTTLAATTKAASLPSTRLFDSNTLDKLPTVNPTKGLDFAAASKQQASFTGYTAPSKPTNTQAPTVKLTSSLNTNAVQTSLFKDNSLSWSAISNNTKPIIGTTTLSGGALDSAYSPTKFTDPQVPTTKLGLSTSSFDTLVKAGYFDAPLSPSKPTVDARSGSVLSGSSFNKLVDAGLYDAPLSPTRLTGPAQDLSPTRVLGDVQIHKYAGPSIFADPSSIDTTFVGPVRNLADAPVIDYKGPSILDPSIRNPTDFVGPVQDWTPTSPNVAPPVRATYQLAKTTSDTYTFVNSTTNLLSTANSAPSSSGVSGTGNVSNPYQTNAMIAQYRDENFDHWLFTKSLSDAHWFSSKVLADALASSAGVSSAGAYAAPRLPVEVHYS